MNMTHYMELLASNQPWNLLIFMAVPVIFAETIAITELYLLFTRNFTGTGRKINKWASILGGTYFLGVFIYLFLNAVIPITAANAWRGAGDIIAVGGYLAGVIPLFGLTLLEFGMFKKDPQESLKLHVTFVALFLIIAHIAMIFGMLAPSGYPPVMPDGMAM